MFGWLSVVAEQAYSLTYPPQRQYIWNIQYLACCSQGKPVLCCSSYKPLVTICLSKECEIVHCCLLIVVYFSIIGIDGARNQGTLLQFLRKKKLWTADKLRLVVDKDMDYKGMTSWEERISTINYK